MVQGPSGKGVTGPAQSRLSLRPQAPEGRPSVQGVRLLAGDPSLLKVELQEPVELEHPDRCEDMIVDKETLEMMKVCPLVREINLIRKNLEQTSME